MNLAIQIGLVIISASLPLVLVAIGRRFRKLRPERELTLRLNSQSNLPEVDLGARSSQLQVRWAGQPIDRLVVSRWRLQNSGQQPIRREDFDDSISIDFGSSRLLDAWVASSDPVDLAKRVISVFSVEDNFFRIQPMLWNPKEAIDLTVVTRKPIDLHELSPDARIVGGGLQTIDDRITTERPQAQRKELTMYFTMAYAAGLAALAALLLSILLR